VNWRTGNWQGYFDQDFEAIIDLQKVEQVNSVGVHVLQDMPAWILFPKSMIIYSSYDGKEFKEAGKVDSPFDEEQSQKVKEMLLPVQLNTRYIKVKLLNGGKLPASHESAGSPSHLFIDEVLVK
ncbi:MAG: discoidin domain-containing protein, partial [Candidatus Dadabacteria bacterium]